MKKSKFKRIKLVPTDGGACDPKAEWEAIVGPESARIISRKPRGLGTALKAVAVGGYVYVVEGIATEYGTEEVTCIRMADTPEHRADAKAIVKSIADNLRTIYEERVGIEMLNAQAKGEAKDA